MAGNSSDRKIDKILEGMQYLIGDNKLLREEFMEHARQAAEDREEFRKLARQAAEDRHEMKEMVQGIRKALVVIGMRGREFIDVQKKNTAVLEDVHRLLKDLTRNGGAR